MHRTRTVGGECWIQEPIGGLFFLKFLRAHKAATVARGAIGQRQGLHHAVAVEHHALAIGTSVVQSGADAIQRAVQIGKTPFHRTVVALLLRQGAQQSSVRQGIAGRGQPALSGQWQLAPSHPRAPGRGWYLATLDMLIVFVPRSPSIMPASSHTFHLLWVR